MELNYLAIIAATVAQFVMGWIWYGPFFGNLWGKIHGFDKLSKEVQLKMMKAMAPFYGLQLLVTIITTVVLSILLTALPDWNMFALAALVWLGFVVPTQVSGVIFGGTEGKWILSKIAVQAGGALAFLLVAAFILNLF
jgi:hypothetical protein